MPEENYALVRDGLLVELKHVPDDVPLPSHKIDVDGGPLLRPYINASAPAHEPTLEVATFENVVSVEAVTKVWTVQRRSMSEQIAAVKNESGRRIYTPFPQWRQANYTARAAELVDKKSDGETLTAEEVEEMAYLRTCWAWIKSVREASNALEAMDPIPADYRLDTYWPAAWEE